MLRTLIRWGTLAGAGAVLFLATSKAPAQMRFHSNNGLHLGQTRFHHNNGLHLGQFNHMRRFNDNDFDRDDIRFSHRPFFHRRFLHRRFFDNDFDRDDIRFHRRFIHRRFLHRRFFDNDFDRDDIRGDFRNHNPFRR